MTLKIGKIRYYLTALYLISTGLYSTGAVWADPGASPPPGPSAIISVGTAAVLDRNTADARIRAISNGLTDAVGEALAASIGPEKISTDFSWINQRFYEKPDDFVKEYKVLAEHQVGDHYRVLLSVVIQMDPLQKALSEKGMVVNAPVVGLPTVLVCVAEKMSDTGPYGYWWAPAGSSRGVVGAAISEALASQGIKVLDPKGTLPMPILDKVGNQPELSDADAALLGRHVGADVVVVGTARIEPGPAGVSLSLRTLQAALQVRAVRTAAGDPILSMEDNAVTVDSDAAVGGRKALSQVGASVGERLVKDLPAVWAKAPAAKEGSPTLTLLVSGTQQISSFLGFRKILSQLPGVTEVEIKQMQRDQAEMAITYSGSAQQMADALLSKSTKEISMDIQTVTPHSLTIHLIPR
jgi:hypothetical protein